MSRRPRPQPRVKGITRIPIGTSALPALEAWVRKEAKFYGVSKAFVIANCISFASGRPMISYREGTSTRKVGNVIHMQRRAHGR